MLRYFPGIIGAIAGFLILQFTGWLNNWSYEFIAYIAVYLFVSISLEIALVRYGNKTGR